MKYQSRIPTVLEKNPDTKERLIKVLQKYTDVLRVGTEKVMQCDNEWLAEIMIAKVEFKPGKESPMKPRAMNHQDQSQLTVS